MIRKNKFQQIKNTGKIENRKNLLPLRWLLIHLCYYKKIVYFDLCIEKKELRSVLQTKRNDEKVKAVLFQSLRHKKRTQSSQSKGHVKLARTGHPKGHHFLRPTGCHIFFILFRPFFYYSSKQNTNIIRLVRLSRQVFYSHRSRKWKMKNYASVDRLFFFGKLGTLQEANF